MRSDLRASVGIHGSRPVGRYELRQELARGGMGTVYSAFDRVVGREIAYKRLDVADATACVRGAALFQREFTTLAQLAHPAIVEVYDYGSDEQGPYYTMELLSGGDLLGRPPLPVAEVCRVLRDVASALALVHARRLIHRDVSPGNVFITDDGRAKLLDFGALSPFGVARDVVGTPAFMAPESLLEQPLDQRADLYSLGALAYWALTHRPALRARTLDELSAAWEQPVERPSLFVDLPRALEELVLWLLHKDPASRPASAAEVVERLTGMAELPPEQDEQKVAHSYLRHPPLVGRDAVFAELDALLHATVNGNGGVVLIEGPRGVGRSAVLGRVMLEAQLAGATVLSADASADTSEFGLARQLTRLGIALDPRLYRASVPRDSNIAQLLRSDRGGRGEGAWSPLEASQRQARTLSHMEKLLLGASDKNPTVILIDELHLADAESLALIASLASEAKQRALLLVLSVAAENGQNQALATIAAIAKRLALSPLSEAETVEVVSSVFGAVQNSHRLARCLYEQSGGRPARIIDLARLLLQRGVIRYARGTFALPHDVSAEALASESEDALLTRVAGLSEEARELASFLSLQEIPLDCDLIGQALGLGNRAVVLACEELRRRELVSAVDQEFALRSAGLREAISAAIPEETRRELHRKAARTLLARAASSSELRMQAGIHLLKAGDELRAAELLTERSQGDWMAGKTPVALLEAVLEIMRRQGRTDEQCLSALVPLVRGGFFGDMRAQRRHLDRTLAALSNVCGVATAARLTPRLGPKLALIAGVLGAAIRHGFTPRKERFGTFEETIAALLSILSATTAAAASAWENEDSFRIVRMFEPLRGFGPDSAPYLTIEFCLATAEIGAGMCKTAQQRYARLLERFDRPVKGMDAEVHLQFRQGILNGLAQAQTVDTERESLVLADELEQKHVFFAPHAEVIRASFHGSRGEQHLCDVHKKRAELLALRGGISWSSVTVMTNRMLIIAMMTGDVVAALRLLPELERLADAEIAPKARLICAAGEAWLELIRGRPEEAVKKYEQLFASPHAAAMTGHYADRLVYARALAAIKRVPEAKQVCTEVLEKYGPTHTGGQLRPARQLLAYLELLEGRLETATRRLEDLLEEFARYDNPLWSGSLHRDLARIALLQGKPDGFEQHFTLMRELFQSTKNPTLMQQVEQLQSEASQKRGREQPPPARESRAPSDDLDSMKTVIEPNSERIAALTVPRVRANDNDDREDEASRKLG